MVIPSIEVAGKPLPLLPKTKERARHEFQARTPTRQIERLKRMKEREGAYGITLQRLYLGITAVEQENGQIDVGFAAHDGTYSIDFASYTVGAPRKGAGHDKLSAPFAIRSQSPLPSGFDVRNGSHEPSASNTPINGNEAPLTREEVAARLTNYFVQKILDYEADHLYKFVGVGISKVTLSLCPELPAHLWAVLDTVPLVFGSGLEDPLKPGRIKYTVDEQADSMARKCIMYFGPSNQPRVQVGYRNKVEVDSGGHVHLASFDQYKATVGERTWEATLKYAEALKARKVKIAFFNSTPQGGGVALMRHALVRFLRILGVDVTWYVPKPKPEVFRITKNNHNILQGVADPDLRLTKENVDILEEWANENAERFWVHDGGPLASPEDGGADVIFVDDPQMPNLIPIAKRLAPKRPVVFRSHIQVRSDLIDKVGSPTSEVWAWLWKSVDLADLFISHPVREFVPSTVDHKILAYLPATTDWLDGLNKDLSDWDLEYYTHEFNTESFRVNMPHLDYPARDYIAQIARFDPAKGIPDVLASYAELRRNYLKDAAIKDIPQLVLAGHGAVDDPDASAIYDQTLGLLETKYKDLQSDVIVRRVGPSDQALNAIISNARVVLQLSTREGFEVKVSEALHKGIPVIATLTGGIPLQVQDGKSGFLVQPGDSKAVAKHLHHLLTNVEAYDRMSEYAATHVSDEVSTVGNALAWLYLADVLSKGDKLEPNGRWVNDLAREAVGLDYVEGENRLPRLNTLK